MLLDWFMQTGTILVLSMCAALICMSKLLPNSPSSKSNNIVDAKLYAEVKESCCAIASDVVPHEHESDPARSTVVSDVT